MSVLKPDNDRPTAPAARDTAQAKNIKIEIRADMSLPLKVGQEIQVRYKWILTFKFERVENLVIDRGEGGGHSVPPSLLG